MTTTHVCCTLFTRCLPDALIAAYLTHADEANGYLVALDRWQVFVDAHATETADWARQIHLAIEMIGEGGISLSLFIVSEHWAIAIARDGEPGPIAVFVPEEKKTLAQLPAQLLAVEQALADYFPNELDVDRIDATFGAMLDGGMTAEEGFIDLLDALGCRPDWIRWSWFETIPEQLFTDPDLARQVTPLGEAKQFWSE